MQVVSSNIGHYVSTEVSASLFNPSPIPQELLFKISISDLALVTGLTMTTHGIERNANVQNIYHAFQAYQQDQNNNQTTILMKSDFKNGQKLTIFVSLEGYGKTNLKLSFEENLLQRNGSYNQNFLLNSDMIVHSLSASFKLNMTDERIVEVDFGGQQYKIKKKYFNKKMEDMIISLDENGRVQSQFQIRYSTEAFRLTDNATNKLDQLTSQDYFLHYFSLAHLLSHPKHVVFVLDAAKLNTSDDARHIKDAMNAILGEINEQDHFSIIGESTGSWRQNCQVQLSGTNQNKVSAHQDLNLIKAPSTSSGHQIQAWNRTITCAQRFRTLKPETSQVIIFLTYGHHHESSGQDLSFLLNMKRRLGNAPIYSLVFGWSNDYSLLTQLSEGANVKAFR